MYEQEVYQQSREQELRQEVALMRKDIKELVTIGDRYFNVYGTKFNMGNSLSFLIHELRQKETEIKSLEIPK